MKKKQLFTVICLSILFSIGIWTFSIQSAQLVTGNDNARKAFQIPYSGYECKVEFLSESDERWFKINVEKTSSIKPIYKEGDAVNYELYSANQLTESNPVPIYSNNDFGGYSWNKQLPYKVEKGEYYIRLTPRRESTKNLVWSIEVLVEDLYEPNDNYLSSKVISPGIINFNLYGTNDIDWFKVEVTQPGSIIINALKAENLRFELYSEETLINSQPSPLIQESGLGDHLWTMSRSYSVQPGIYYFKFTPNGDWPKSNPIQIDYSFIPDDDFEPNNIYSQAKLINDGIYDINLVGENDIDWFKLVVDKPSSFLIEHLEGPGGSVFELYEENDLELGNPNIHSQQFASQSWNKIIRYKLNPGIYYIKLRYDQYLLQEGNFKFSFKLNMEDEYEINDTWEQASTIPSGIHNLRLSAPNDIDWLKINISEDTPLRISVEPNNGIHVQVYREEELINNTNKIVMSKNNLGKALENEMVKKLDAGIYYLKFTPNDDPNLEEIPIKIELLANDLFEPNDTWEEATELEIGKNNAITINAPNDIDWFKFSLPTKTTLRLIMNSSISKNFKYEIYSEDNSSKIINSGALNSNGGNQAVVLNAGEYRIKLSGDDYNYSEEELLFLINVDGVDITRPKITSVSPTGNNNDINRNIEITFSKPMDLDTIIKENFSIKYFNDEIDFNLDYIESENRVILIPTEPLNYNGQYHVTILKSVKARNNQLEMASNYEYQFKTREKRPNDNEVGTVRGTIELPKNLQIIASVGTIEVFKDNNRIKTINPDRYGKFTLNDLEVGNYSIWAKIPGFLNDSISVVVGYGDDLTVTLYPTIGDLNGDGIIDLYDITIVSQGYNEESR